MSDLDAIRTPSGEWFRVPRIGRGSDGGEDVTLHDLLARLGATPDAVAETLRAEGCNGPPYNDCFCPVANYLRKHTGQAASAAAFACSLGEFRFEDGIPVEFDPRVSARTPEPVAQLITAYDHGDYAFLRD